MKLFTSLLFAASASAAAITSRQNGQSTLQKGAQTLVLKEVGGIPGNECLTFRNNGEIVDAACVNTAADRQLTPSTIGGANVLAVQRSFSNGFRPDLVNAQACVGFNGTHFKALDCADRNLDPVSLQNGKLVSASGACQSGHDNAAQITVDPSGQKCAQLTSTRVQATAT
ncbi:uncharacterized protein M421DRAFT_68005 [Didymella exigua CBS 183.55]|uniref:Cyanovirin-N domain-containing protein n=1 Tax=Didymella exigua CBS 183.55 TaxID=1150837 RepID=A0A6A5RL98_9PLEO|nr:uncharacterized protein M421DRAFT_68005 [Didymella exigua CBS 183.55]KAF1926317.1 hypothetical protein M421DRAFT_68005 [Didymella exigua CBS 183.55]